jgi:N-acetylglucosamine-6-phosphate deacetylase
MVAFAPTRLFTGHAIVEAVGVCVENGRITDLTATAPADAIKLDGLLAPGFIDVQVNGGGGVLFNDAPDLASLRAIASAHAQFGVTGFMATLISDERNKTRNALESVSAALAAGVPGLVGLHLEGPWLAEARRGVHPARFLRRFDADDLALLAQSHAFPLLLTVAPEQIDLEALAKLVAAGVVVSLGHTTAGTGEIEAALKAGARGFTHLFNAMPPLQSREPGPVGAALAHKESWAGIILDAVHVHPLTARIALDCKTAEKLMLVSDGMATVGSPTPAMNLFGERISVESGALRTGNGTLAGAHLDLASAVRNAIQLVGASPEEALRMASLTPAEFLGLGHERGRIAPGFRADFVLLSDEMDAKKVWINGEAVR